MGGEGEPDELITTGDAALMLGVRSATVAAWLRSGKLTGIRRDKLWLVPRRDVEALVAERLPDPG